MIDTLKNFVRDEDGATAVEYGLIDTLDDEGLIMVLAEPNLTAKSGKPATFLAGGEFPIVVPVDGKVTDTYVRMTRLIERLHRRHLDILRFELDRLGIDGISAAQSLMTTKIEGQTIGVRNLVERGY